MVNLAYILIADAECSYVNRSSNGTSHCQLAMNIETGLDSLVLNNKIEVKPRNWKNLTELCTLMRLMRHGCGTI